MSTRSPQKLKDYAARGVLCVYDAAQVAALADVLVISCLPRHLLQVPPSLSAPRLGLTHVCTAIAEHVPWALFPWTLHQTNP